MSVNVTGSIVKREFAGYLDPSLPLGIWQIQLGATGDGTGGDVLLDTQFNNINSPRDSQFYNLEHIMSKNSSVTARVARLNVINLGEVWGSAVPTFPLSHVSESGLGEQSLPLSVTRDLPLWLGRQLGAAATTTLRFAINNEDLIVYLINLGGYFWGPRSINAEGGPRRPSGGFFGK